MREVIKQNHSVAWFSLSQFISRGEKEKALSIYKLLSRSINDKALILQLEGDILNSFTDEEALDKYIQSGKIYISEDRISEAINIYEKIICLTEQPIYLDKLLDLYIQNHNHNKMDSLLNAKLNHMLKKDGQELHKFLSKLDALDEKYHKKAISILESNL